MGQVAGMFDALHAVAGLVVGVLVGLTGVGGGSLMTPLLVLMFGVAPHTAVGTDLLFAGTTKVAGSAVHGWRETVDWTIVRRLAAGSIPASIVALALLSRYGRIDASSSRTILLVLGVMLVLTAVATLFQRRLAAFAHSRRPRERRDSVQATILLGALLGAVVSISSVGAGAIGVTALLLLYPHLPVARVVGTDIAHAVPLAFLGGLGHWVLGDVDLSLLASLLAGSIPGVIAGSLVSSRAPDRWLRPALAAVLLLSGYKLLA